MDATRCPHCNERMKVIGTSDGRTGFQCLQCDKADPLRTNAMKGAFRPLTVPTKAASFVLPTNGGIMHLATTNVGRCPSFRP